MSEAGPSTLPLPAQTRVAKAPKTPRAKPTPVPVGPFVKPAEEEEKTVHEVYEAIAGHFSQTRHKPWPLIKTFLHSLPPNALGLDSGAGNGKYLPTSREAGLEMIALDRSQGLLDIAKNENRGECVRGDLCFNGWRNGVFDFAISVAAIHHLSTPERRIQSVKTLIRPLKLSPAPPYSRFMIYVWAYEQGTLSKRAMGSAANSASASTATSDLPPAAQPGESSRVEDANQAQEVKDADVEKKIQDVLVPWVYSKPPPHRASKPATNSLTASEPAESNVIPEEPKVYHRYYHLFLEGELREMVVQAAKEDGYTILLDGVDEVRAGREGNKWMRIRGVGWEADNWWIEGEVGI
ncbi:uncharacterized protein IL334_005742 [Kwoniella shivajii]|uniref:Methyltransferase type 11 domain-containing protein n=1 Tax=Kwoniella shivajii TaxID=564305 RepID=A0ABZ1D599_9TREE|nr:hypothetical protein IL334_005742 [Kwoniella shivajii]